MAPLRKIDMESEYAENPKLKREDVNKLREHANKCHPNFKLSDLDLFLLLHSCYYDLEKATKTLDCFVSCRTRWSSLFVDVSPDSVPRNMQIETTLLWPLEQKSVKNYKTLYFKFFDADASLYDHEDQVKLFLYLSDLFLSQYGNEEGFLLAVDFKLFSWKHLSKVKLGTTKKAITYVQEAFPIRLKEIHLLNSWTVVDKLLTLMKLFMSKELYDIIYVHTRMDTFYEHVSKSALPKDLGGNDLSLDEMHARMVQYLTDNSNRSKEIS